MRLRRNPLFERELRASADFHRSLDRETRRVAAAAEQVAAQTEQTGDFRRSLSTDGHTVVSSDPFAHLIEFGSINNPPYAPFRRGIGAAGLRFDDTPST